MDCTAHGVAKSRTRLRDFHFTLTVVLFLISWETSIAVCLPITSVQGFPFLHNAQEHLLSPVFCVVVILRDEK